VPATQSTSVACFLVQDILAYSRNCLLEARQQVDNLQAEKSALQELLRSTVTQLKLQNVKLEVLERPAKVESVTM